MIEIEFSDRAQKYISEKNYRHLLIKISLFSEKCVQIYEPVIISLSSEELDFYQDCTQLTINGMVIYLDKQFLELYPSISQIFIERQRFPKRLFIKNLDPIIINTCRVDDGG